MLIQAFACSLTCRRRRLKCSEEKPSCSQCEKSERDCRYAKQDSASAVSSTSSKQGLSDSRDAEFPLRSSLTSLDEGSEGAIQGTSIGTPSASSLPSNSAFDKTFTVQDVQRTDYVRRDGINSSVVSLYPVQHVRATSLETRSVPEVLSQIFHQTSPATGTISPSTQAASLISPGQAPYEWWDQIAQDAAKSSEHYQFLKDSQSKWSFEPIDVSRSLASTPRSFLHNNGRSGLEEQETTIARLAIVRGNGIGSNDDTVAKEPWNTTDMPVLCPRELSYLHYYINNVGPIFDLFDPNRSFTNTIPHLAMRNVGLLKSVLAVSARFKSLHSQEIVGDQGQYQSSNVLFSSTDDEMSTEFYFETLSYLSQAMQYPSYTRSQEILATAALISSYEYFHVDRSTDWEKHLKGVFWIQRSQETNGEREGLPGAVWWAWLRQDIWAALWQKRQPLTIWEYTKPVDVLHGHEFASRATFMLARAIKYAYSENQEDICQRILDSDKLFSDLQEWYHHLPPSYRPLPTSQIDRAPELSVFPIVWIHPTYHAAAMQNYYSAVIMLLLHRPPVEGGTMDHDVPRILEEAVGMICGLAQCHAASDYPSAMVNFQALYVAGHCVRTTEHQKALYLIFERILDANKFPSKSLLSDLESLWKVN